MNINNLSEFTPEAKEDLQRMLDVNGGSGSGNSDEQNELFFVRFSTNTNDEFANIDKTYYEIDTALYNGKHIIPILSTPNVSMRGNYVTTTHDYGQPTMLFDFFRISNDCTKLLCYRVSYSPIGGSFNGSNDVHLIKRYITLQTE